MATIKIDPEFVDVDFEKRRPKGVGLGWKAGASYGYRDYAAARPVLTRAQCIEEGQRIQAEGTGNAQLVVEVKNQRNEGSCVGNASTSGLQVIQARRLGKDKVTLLSAIATYKQIGRSAQSGAMIDDSMEALQEVGTLPLDTAENREKYGNQVMPATGFSTRFPANWKETAKHFRLDEVLVCRGVDQLLTALVCGHPVVVGRAGHSILYLDVIYKSGRLYVLYVNSWGQWGQGAGDFSYGFGLDSESYIRSSASWAYAMCSMVEKE
jgi:hypothetical protein